jgi:hypothetical protein
MAFQDQHGLVCAYDADERVLFLQKNFALPDIASRLCGEAYYISVTCDWTSKKEQ